MSSPRHTRGRAKGPISEATANVPDRPLFNRPKHDSLGQNDCSVVQNTFSIAKNTFPSVQNTIPSLKTPVPPFKIRTPRSKPRYRPPERPIMTRKHIAFIPERRVFNRTHEPRTERDRLLVQNRNPGLEKRTSVMCSHVGHGCIGPAK